MKKVKMGLSVVLLALLAACSGGGGKKVLIMSSGKISVSEDQKTITLDPGTTHNEKEIDLGSGEKITLTVKSPDGSKTYDVTENGHYLLNLKTDTLVGGVVRYGNSGIPTSLSNEQVDHIIDSTRQLMAGQNASDANKTYFLPPFVIKKITTEEGSKIVGPYNAIPRSVDVDQSGKTQEVYKFVTNKQTRETLDDLTKQRQKAQQ
ncbi:MAG: hypothetical protein INR73_24100 [Williamsia sp.]|nr:hypothetical protein [Williamsia sp.]